jgi:glycosyltransferase involved in cell wall biosynthesis
MKVSTVIPTYNRRTYIKRAIDSVLAQTVPVDEIVIVDDIRSTDCVEEAIEKWYGSKVRVVKESGGLSGARRRCVQEAQGEWIAFLDSDDEWVPERNAEFLSAAERLTDDVAWVFGDMRVVTDEGDGTTLFGEYGLSVTECPHVFADSLSVQYPFMFGLLQSSLIRRRVLTEMECFKEGLQSSEDLLAAFQVACCYRFAAIPSIVGRRILTSDLAASSASVAGVLGPDYFRARMLAFSLVIASGQSRPWTMLYAAQVRGLCKVLAKRGDPVPIRLAIEQFRFGGISIKSTAFLCATLAGRRGIRMWNGIAELRRKYLRSPQVNGLRKSGHRGWAESLTRKTV